MTIGGITDINHFAITNQLEWKEQASSLSKYKPSLVIINPHQLRRLSALSLWARVRIVFGDETNFDNLSQEHAQAITEREICRLESSTAETAVDLTSKITFEEWSTSFLRSLRHELNEEGVSLAYVLRKETPPQKFTSLHEKLE